jgi:hypothetical protein
MNANDLLYAIAKRARDLCDKPVSYARLCYGTADTITGAIEESKGMSKGEVIEAVLIDEFDLDANKIDTKEGE